MSSHTLRLEHQCADSTGDIRIWRKSGHPDFDRDKVGLLSLIAPGIRADAEAYRATPT